MPSWTCHSVQSRPKECTLQDVVRQSCINFGMSKMTITSSKVGKYNGQHTIQLQFTVANVYDEVLKFMTNSKYVLIK